MVHCSHSSALPIALLARLFAGLFLLIALGSATPPAARAGVQPEPFYGWLVSPLGEAVLGDEPPPPFLDVNNIGSSGQDGVRVEVGATRGHVGPVRWMAPESIRDRQYKVVVSGSDAAGELSWGLRGQDLGGGMVQFSIDPGNFLDPAGEVLLSLSEDGNPLYEELAPLTSNPLFEGSAPPTGVGAGRAEAFEALAPSPTKMKVKDVVREDLLVEFPAGTQITLPGAGSFQANEMRISSRLRHRDRLVLHHIDVLFAEPVGSTGSQRLNDVAMGPYDAETRARGGVRLRSSADAAYEHLVLGNIGSSGQDGVAVEMERDERGEAFLWDTASLPAPLLGDAILVDAEGHRSMVPDQPVAGTSCRYMGSYFEIQVDAANTLPPTAVEFYAGGVFVAGAADPAAALQIRTTSWPNGGGVEAEDDWGTPTAVWTWDAPVAMVSGVEPAVMADEVRLVIPSAHRDVDSIDRVVLSPPVTPTGEWTLLGRRNLVVPPNPIVPPEPVYPWLSLRGLHGAGIVHRDIAVRVSNIGSSGENGVKVEFEPANSLGIQWQTAWSGSPGERIMNPVYGTTSGHPDRPIIVGRLWHESTGTEFLVGADLSPVGASGVRYKLYDDGVVVASIEAVNDAPALSMGDPPNGMEAILGNPPRAVEPSLFYPLPQNTLVSEVGMPAKRAIAVDLIEVQPAAAPSDFPTELVALGVQAQDLPWVVLDDFPVLLPVDAPPGRDTAALRLLPNVPNPFNPRTRVAFELGVAGPASLRIYDARGQLVDILHEGFASEGHHEFVWDGEDLNGRSVASGVYHLRLEAEGRTQSRKMSLVR